MGKVREKNKIWYSDDGETYRCETLHEAVLEKVEDSEFTKGSTITVFKGEGVSPVASNFAPKIIDYMSENAYDNHGEYAEDWPNVAKEDIKILQDAVEKVIDDWATKLDEQPTFGTIINIEEINIELTDNDGGFNVR